MGTRADYYVGRGANAEWLGSIAWDGDNLPEEICAATDEATFRKSIAEWLSTRNDATLPKQGWPWPWNDSRTTDYSFAFDDGCVYRTYFGHGWQLATSHEPPEDDDTPKVEFPDMSKVKNVSFGERSGLLIFGGR